MKRENNDTHSFTHELKAHPKKTAHTSAIACSYVRSHILSEWNRFFLPAPFISVTYCTVFAIICYGENRIHSPEPKSSQLCSVICSSVTAASFGTALDSCNRQRHYFNECVALRAPSIIASGFFSPAFCCLSIDKWRNGRRLSPHFWRCMYVLCIFFSSLIFILLSIFFIRTMNKQTDWKVHIVVNCDGREEKNSKQTHV